jgi:hypothetical protein
VITKGRLLTGGLLVAALLVTGVWAVTSLLAADDAGTQVGTSSDQVAPADPDSGRDGDGDAENADSNEQDDGDEERLAELRETDRFEALAEAERAKAYDDARPEFDYGWNAFAVVEDGEVVHEWDNKEELWNEVVPPIRDELLLLGEPYEEAMWDEGQPLVTNVFPRWSDETTGGRGQYIEIQARYETDSGQPTQWIGGLLIETTVSGGGRLASRMTPLELARSQAEGYRHSREIIENAAWDWVQEQNPSRAD